MPNNATRPTAIAAPATNTTAGSGLLTNEADRSLALNQTERFRRLIPYMTFYVPGGQPSSSSAAAGDYLPINQAYSYAPAVSRLFGVRVRVWRVRTRETRRNNSSHSAMPM